MGALQRRIIPDYRRPHALIVPHYDSTIRSTLEAIAEQASRHSGIILLTQDRAITEAFIAAQATPELFHILTAPYDTPWLRDRSPIAVKQGKDIHWALPQLDTPDRPLDQTLFQSMTRKPVEPTHLQLPQGNLVAGPRGRAVVLLRDEQDAGLWREELSAIQGMLGVSRWILAPAFSNEVTGHADVHMRFLGPTLGAIAWSEDSSEDRERAEYLQAQINIALADMQLIRLPLRSDGPHYASPLNWLQFGRHLLLPRYQSTPADDIRIIRQRLGEHGFKPRFIYSPTLEYAGSLHCLTASIHV